MPNQNEKILDKGEYIVAIRTGINYWHILTGRENMMTVEDADDYASHFSDRFQTAVLKVEKVTTKANGHTS